MISFIKGKVFRNSLGDSSFVEIETSSGVGYKVVVSKRFDFKKEGEGIFLFTSFQVREDSQTLYGFDLEKEKILFEKLLSVSGIGPKIAISILSEYTCEKIQDIVLKSDVKALSKVSGLGKKGAQKIILELVGKVDLNSEESGDEEVLKDVRSALQSLGYNGIALKDAMKKADDIFKEKEMPLEEILKLVLKG